jgi:TolA-binding protein
MQIRTLFIHTILLLSLLESSECFSQQPVQQLDPDAAWQQALDLWNKEKYAAAQKLFIEVEAYYTEESSTRKADCQFYSAYCALKLYNKDAEFLFRRFIELNPEDPRDDLVYYLLAKNNFERKKYSKSLEWIDQIDINGLPNTYHSDYYYYKGFSLFKEDRYDDALLSLSNNLQEGDPYYFPALYYTAYINYTNEHYQLALEQFQVLANEEGFSELVPYYVSQIFFLQERYLELIEYAEPWIDEVSTKRKGEMARLLAEAYYYEGNYEKSLEYYAIYFASPAQINRDDYYAYGYCLYKTGKYEDAITQFNRVINEKDALTQIALLNMGDCYLKLDKLKYAQNAFKNASQFDFNEDIKEEAFFNYAKLSYKLSFDPYDEAIQAFEAYLDTYPHSNKKDEAYIFLLNVYMKTKNYQSALAVIEKIKNPDYKVKSAYQLAVYNIAVEYYQQKNYDEALRWFQYVAKYDFEKVTLAESYFWQGELKFKKKNFRGAIESYSQFISATDSYQSKYFSRAYYGKAYSQLKLKAYTKALENFHQFIHFDKAKNTKLDADAEQRIGDIYFLQKNYQQAISYYRTALNKSDFDKDYALFQIAMSQGYLMEPESKILTLHSLIDEVPESVYRPQAMFEIGSTYFEMENYQMALDILEDLETNYPSNKLVAESYLKRGLIYIKLQDNDSSRDAFLYVFENYPNSKAANEALISLKEVDMATFTRLAKETGYAGISEEDVDAANFEEAEEVYLSGNYERSAFLLGHYLTGFPNGRFRQNAHFYKADCHVRLDQQDSALVQFEYLLDQPGNPYYDNALYTAANLARSLNDDEKTYAYYQLLYQTTSDKQYQSEALDYMMRLGYEYAEYLKVLQWAELVRTDEKRDDAEQQEALLYEINAYLQLDEKQNAIALINEVNFDLVDEITAELAFLKAQWLFEEQNYTEAEEALYFLLQNYGAYGEWRANGFILLGDVYLALDDPFQAKATWQSVIDHHDGQDLVIVAQQKLDRLIQQEEDENSVEEIEEEVDYPKGEVQVIESPANSIITESIEVLPTDSIKQEDE